MKCVLQINSVINTGSTGRIAEDIGEELIKNNWRSIIAYGRYGNISNSEVIRIGNHFENYLHVAKSRLFDQHGLGSKVATMQFINKINEIKPDIIHLHNLHGYYINIEVLFKYLSKLNTPIVWTLHDCWAFTGHCVHFEEIDCDKWKTQCYNCPQTKTYPKSLFADNSSNNYLLKKDLFNSVKNMTIVPVSNWLDSLIADSFLQDFPRRTINNGVNLNMFEQNTDRNETRIKFNLADKFSILGVASIWGESKGLYDFISLSEKLESNEQLILVGLNKKQKNKLPKNIIGIERTERFEDLVALYEFADVFVNPTYADTFPTTNLEALASGTPIVTYNTGGSIEPVTDETGFIINKGEIPELIQAIRAIKEKGKKFYSRACRERAIKKYNKFDRYSEYIKLYKSVMS